MTDLDQRLRTLFDTPPPVPIEEVMARRAPRRPVAGRRGLTAASLVVLALLVAAGAVLAVRTRSGTTVAVRTPPAGAAPVVVTVAVDRTTVVAGTPLTVHVSVDNRTGRPLTVCPPDGLITDGISRTDSSSGYAPLTNACTPTRLAAGVTRYTRTIPTGATGCVEAPAARAIATCPKRVVTPMVAGTYHALVSVNGLPAGSSEPRPVRVRLLAAPATATVRGTLDEAGGPTAGTETGLPGTIRLGVQGGGAYDTVAGPDGSFTITVPEGDYVVTGRSPRYDDGHRACRAVDPVVAAVTGRTTTVHVSCTER